MAYIEDTSRQDVGASLFDGYLGANLIKLLGDY
jgi:hypothetical protein